MKQAERDLSCSSRRAFSIHKGSMGSHPSPISLGSLEEKAFSKGVVFEKESNHLSLCIIACSRNISSAGLQVLPVCRSGIQLAVGAAGAAAFREPASGS